MFDILGAIDNEDWEAAAVAFASAASQIKASQALDVVADVVARVGQSLEGGSAQRATTFYVTGLRLTVEPDQGRSTWMEVLDRSNELLREVAKGNRTAPLEKTEFILQLTAALTDAIFAAMLREWISTEPADYALWKEESHLVRGVYQCQPAIAEGRRWWRETASDLESKDELSGRTLASIYNLNQAAEAVREAIAHDLM